MNLRTNRPPESLPTGMRLLPCPRTWVTESFLVTVLMCLPIGIAALAYALKVEPHFSKGRYDEAAEASARARCLIVWGTSIGAVMWAILAWLCLTGTVHSTILTLTI